MIGRRWNAYLIILLVSIWVYVLTSEESPLAIRAAIMGMVSIVALLAGRPGSILSALSLAAAAMVALDPMCSNKHPFNLA